MGRRPYISERGATTRGPIANPRTNIETTSVEVMGERWKSGGRRGTAGANIVEVRGLII